MAGQDNTHAARYLLLLNVERGSASITIGSVTAVGSNINFNGVNQRRHQRSYIFGPRSLFVKNIELANLTKQIPESRRWLNAAAHSQIPRCNLTTAQVFPKYPFQMGRGGGNPTKVHFWHHLEEFQVQMQHSNQDIFTSLQ